MSPDALDALVDDYLRLLSRTRPWSHAEHERVLEVFARWVREGSGDAPPEDGAAQP